MLKRLITAYRKRKHTKRLIEKCHQEMLRTHNANAMCRILDTLERLEKSL